MKHLCNLDRLARAMSVRNTLLWFGEWSLATGFNATDAFLKKWADAQKTMYSASSTIYSASSGWIVSALSDTALIWSYSSGASRSARVRPSRSSGTTSRRSAEATSRRARRPSGTRTFARHTRINSCCGAQSAWPALIYIPGSETSPVR